MEAKQERKEKNLEGEERAHPNEDVVGRHCQVLTTLSSRRTENWICTMDSDQQHQRKVSVETALEARAGGLRSEYGVTDAQTTLGKAACAGYKRDGVAGEGVRDIYCWWWIFYHHLLDPLHSYENKNLGQHLL